MLDQSFHSIKCVLIASKVTANCPKNNATEQHLTGVF